MTDPWVGHFPGIRDSSNLGYLLDWNPCLGIFGKSLGFPENDKIEDFEHFCSKSEKHHILADFSQNMGDVNRNVNKNALQITPAPKIWSFARF